MYTIYSDNNLIYAPNLVDDGYYVTDPKLDMELNLASTLEFGLPIGAVGYNSINKLKSIIKVYDGDTRIFKGRCLSSELDMNNQKSMTCEGELGFLQDSVVVRYMFTGTISQYFTTLINNHNAQVGGDKQFRVGQITVQAGTITASSGDYRSTFDEIKEQLIDRFGGYLIPRYEIENGVEVDYLDYLADSGGQNSQIIEFGSNMIDLSQKIDGQDVFTAIIPLGAVVTSGEGDIPDTRLTIASVNQGDEHLENQTGIEIFGRIYKSVVWDEITDASVLKAKAQSALSSAMNIIPQVELSAIDMHMLNVDVSAIKLGEYNRVISVPHGIDAWLQCVRQSIDLENPEQSLYLFGSLSATLTGINDTEIRKINAVISQGTNIAGNISVIYNDIGTLSDSVNTLSAKSDTIEEGAQVNTIETIMVNGVPVEVIGKTVNITIPT